MITRPAIGHCCLANVLFAYGCLRNLGVGRRESLRVAVRDVWWRL